MILVSLLLLRVIFPSFASVAEWRGDCHLLMGASAKLPKVFFFMSIKINHFDGSGNEGGCCVEASLKMSQTLDRN